MVDKNGEKYMKYYENGRLYPFRTAKIGYHSMEALQMAYDSWANELPGNREEAWDVYCDIRDGYAIGTNRALREKHKQQAGQINDPRYIVK
jgi:hypothetical protein